MRNIEPTNLICGLARIRTMVWICNVHTTPRVACKRKLRVPHAAHVVMHSILAQHAPGVWISEIATVETQHFKCANVKCICEIIFREVNTRT